MEWKHYWQKVVAQHKVMIEDWPDNIPFKNLSEASSALPELKILLEQWQDKTIYWRQLTNEEAERVVEEHKARGEVPDAARRTRSDRGKKRKRPLTVPAADNPDVANGEVVARRMRKRRKVTSAAEVSDDEYADENASDDDY